MNEKETKAILDVLKVNYPQSYTRTDAESAQLLASLWMGAFKEIPYAIVRQTVVKIITESDREFAPNIGQVMAMIRKCISKYNAEEEWAFVCWIVRNADRDSISKELREADEITRKIVSSQDIRRWKDTAGSLDRERPHFIERYNSIANEKENEAIKSGNIMSITTEEKLKAIGITAPKTELIETAGNADGK